MTKAAPNVATRPAAQVGDIIGGGGHKTQTTFLSRLCPSSVCVRNKCGGGERKKKSKHHLRANSERTKGYKGPKSMLEQLTCTVSPPFFGLRGLDFIRIFLDTFFWTPFVFFLLFKVVIDTKRGNQSVVEANDMGK